MLRISLTLYLLALSVASFAQTSMEENISDRDIKKLKAVISENALGKMRYVDGIFDKCPCGETLGCDGGAKLGLEKNGKVRRFGFVTFKNEWRLSAYENWKIKHDKLHMRLEKERNKAKPDLEKILLLSDLWNKSYKNMPRCGN